MMHPPGFVVDHRRRINVVGSHGVGHGGFPICMEPVSGGHGHQGHQSHQNNNSIHVPLPKVENHDGRSRLPPMPVGTMVMTSEPWDPQTMAAHRHMTLIAQGHQSRRAEWTIPPQSCPPGFRPPGMYLDEPAVVHQQQHQQQHPKPEVNFRNNNEGMLGRKDFSRNNWGDDPLGKHLNYVHGISSSTGGGGSVSNRGWFADEGLSNSGGGGGGGGMLENRVAAYPHKLPPALHLPQPQGDRAQEHAFDPDLTWKEPWREQPLSHYGGQPPPPPPPGQPPSNNNIIPNSSYFGEFPPKIPQEENAATIHEPRNRRHMEETNGNLQEPPPPKRSRIEEELGIRSYRIPRHDLEIDSERPDQLRVVADDRSLSRDQSNNHHYSLEQREKHLEQRRLSSSPEGRGDSQSTLGRQHSKTRHNPPHDFHPERGPGSHHAKPHAKFPSESHRDLQLHSRSNFPPTPPRRQSGDPHFRVRSPLVPPRGNHSYHNPSSDTQIRDKIGDGRSLRQGRASRSPCAYQHQSKRRTWEIDSRDRRSIQLLTGKRNVMEEMDERAHSPQRVFKTEIREEPNGTTPLKPSRGLVGATKEEGSRSSSQLTPIGRVNENSHISAMSKKVDNNSKIAASGLVSKGQSQSLPAPFLRDDSDQFHSKMMVLKAEQSGVLDRKMMPSHKNARQRVKGKGSLSTGCHGWKTEENKAILIKAPAPRGGVKNPMSTSALEKIVSQGSEVDMDCPPEKVTLRRRRGGSVTRLQSTAANPSRVDLREDLLTGKQEFVCQRTDSIKSGQIEDDGQKHLFRCRNGAGNLQGGKDFLENVSLEALNSKQSETREDSNTETSLSKQPVLNSKLSFEAKPHKLHGPDNHSAVNSDIGNGVDGRSGQTVIFTGHKAEPFPKVLNLQRTATGSGSLSSPSLAKTHTPSVRLSRERSGTPCSQPGTGLVLPVLDMKEKGRFQLPLQMSGKKDSPKSRSSVLSLEQSLPDKKQDGRPHQNNEKSEVAASTPSTRNDECRILFAEASDGVQGQDNLSLQNLENSETVTSTMIKQIEEGTRLSGKGSDIVEFTGHLSSAATKTSPEGSLVKNSSLDIANTQPCIENGFDAATDISAARPLLPPDCPAVQEVLLFGTNLNAKSIVVQADEASPAKCIIEEACRTDLQMFPTIVGSEQVNGACKVNVSGAVSVAAGVMNEVFRDEGGNVAHHIEARQMALKQSEESNGDIPNGDGQLAKRQKIMHSAKEKKLVQKTKEVSTPVENDTTGEGPNHVKASKQGKPEVEQPRSSVNGDIRLPVAGPKGVDTIPTSSYPSIKVNFTAQTQSPSSGMGRSYGRNKTWRMGPTAPNTHFSNNQLAQKSASSAAGVPQQAAYVRKRYSIIRLPPPQIGAPVRAVVHPTAISGTCDTAPEFGRTISASTKPNVMRNNNNVSQTLYTGVNKSLVKSESTLNTNGKTVEQGVAALEQLGPLLLSKSSMPLVEEDSKSQLDLIHSNASVVSELKLSEARMSDIEPKTGLALSASSPATTAQVKEARASEYVVSGTRSSMQGKVNQLIVAPSPESGTMLAPIAEKSGNPLGSTPADFYVKKKINQLIRCSVHEDSGKKGTLQDEVQESGERLKGGNKQRKGLSQLKTKHGRVSMQKTGLAVCTATVWTLSSNGRKKSTGTTISRRRRWPTSLFPWKRVSMALYLSRRRPLSEGKKGPSVFYLRNKLQRYRSGHPVYTRSADGFSLHRSGVVSQCGANLKWTKSLEKQSILANEAATKVVVEAEKKKRDRKEAVVMAAAKARAKRRAVQSLATTTKLTSRSATISSAELSVPSSVSVSEMSQNGGAVYVRKGFGNQLVRDMKTSRGLANEKVRWSLHNARFRKAKKQAYCVYYTRFGQCKRGDDKCLYIHDCDKVAVCTKFLRGLCSDPKCTLTHKVIPERMSDCSYFLEGLCTNEKCPYRHVNVNPKAPVCEGFLQGYCADGDMCNKKHTYVCPEYIEKGECSHSDTCKRRHPKKVKQASPASKEPVTSKREHRYFMSTFPLKEDNEGQQVPHSNSTSNFTTERGDDWTDFISIDEGGIEIFKEVLEPDGILHERNSVQLSRLPKDRSLIKPRFLLEHLEASG